MRLRSLRIRRLPGIDPGFELTDVAAGVNVVIGPNASGKSSVLRAVRALLYAEELPGAPVDVDAVFEDEGEELRATRVGGVVAWTRDGAPVPAPALPPHHLLGCYTLAVEDLSALTGTDEEIARRLGLELLGGYDLDAVRDAGPFKPPGAGRAEAERLRRAEDRLRLVLRERQVLEREQASIASWRRELAEAEAAQEEAAAHERALALLAAHREMLALRERLAAFPEGMDRLHGDEEARLQALQARRDEAVEELRSASVRREEAGRALRASGLEGRDLTASELEERRAMLQELHRLEADAEAIAGGLSRARSGLRRAEAELRAAPPDPGAATPQGGSIQEQNADRPPGHEPPPAAAPGRSSGDASDEGVVAQRPRLDPATLGRVDDALTSLRALDAERRTLETELERLPDPEAAGGAGPEADVDRLRRGRSALTEFLAAARAVRWTPSRVLGLTLVVAGLGATAVLAWRAGAGWPWPAAAGAAALAGLALLLRGGGATARRAATERLRAAGLTEPAVWDRPTAAARLEELDEALARAVARREALTRREDAARRLERVRGEQDETRGRLERVAEAVGFDPHHLDAGFQRWLRLVDAADRARSELDEAGAELARKQAAITRNRTVLTEFLTVHGEPPAVADAGAGLLQRRLEALAERLAARDAALLSVRNAESDAARADSDRARQEREMRALFGAAGLEGAADEASEERALEGILRRRLERLGDFQALRQQLRDAEVLRQDRARELGERPDLRTRAEAGDEAALQTELEALRARAAERDRLGGQIESTERDIARAERDRALEAARAEVQQAAEALEDLVGATLHAEAGRFLLERVAAEHEERSQPSALRRAAEWFRRFTRNRYELDHDSARDPPFAAVETETGERRLPAELSTGTRAQLLLAVRVAFALEAERGGPSLPLFLDEALTTADAERFREVADSLGMLAREDGRQLFYLTARGEDAALWRARSRPDGRSPDAPDALPHIIDIARIRRASEASAPPEALTLPPQREVPSPEGVTPEHYAELLEVPPLDPWRPAERCHLFHLLRDDLPLLRRLAQAEVERVGPLQALLRSRAAGALLTDEERTLLTRRIRALEAFLEGWRRGRGRPVDRGALETSGAVSDTFLDRVDALSRRVAGDAGALLAGLADGDVPRFRSRDREELAAWLEAHGYLDDRPALDAAALRMRLLGALTSEGASGGPGSVGRHPLDEASRLTAWLKAAVEAAVDAG